ncbi:MAG: DUF5721 family protein [Bacillota bacterium]
MTSYTIHDIKQFMKLLLKSPTFDEFTFQQGEIHSNAFFSIHGKKDDADIDEEHSEAYCFWAEIKPFVFESIKGKKLPKIMKLSLSLPSTEIKKFHNTKSVSLNFLFRNGVLLCTLSAMQETFELSKKTEEAWTEYMLHFFKENGVGVVKED